MRKYSPLQLRQLLWSSDFILLPLQVTNSAQYCGFRSCPSLGTLSFNCGPQRQALMLHIIFVLAVPAQVDGEAFWYREFRVWILETGLRISAF